jgi:hypothetical protein
VGVRGIWQPKTTWRCHRFQPVSMASTLPIGKRWWARIRRRGQSISKTLETRVAAEAWAPEQEAAIDKGRNAVDEQAVPDMIRVTMQSAGRADDEANRGLSELPRRVATKLFLVLRTKHD